MTNHAFHRKPLFLCGLILLVCSCDTHNKDADHKGLPQCAHWSIMKCCQLNGVPVTMSFLLENLPPSPKGHSLLQISEILQEIGFETEGRAESELTFHTLTFPLIVHLANPDHFVTVSAVNDKVVHVFDGDGHRTAIDLPSFFARWGGEVLLVTKPENDGQLPAFLPRLPSAPRIQFDSLLLDLGTVPTTGEPVPFEFLFKNSGDCDLVIEDIRPDCSCIKSEKPENKIPPGGKGVIRLFYNVRPQKGAFLHNVIVTTNDPQQPIIALTASGWSGVELKIEPSDIYLPNLVTERENKIRCLAKHSGDGTELSMNLGESTISNSILANFKIEPLTEEKAREILLYTPKHHRYDSRLYLLEFSLKTNGNAGEEIKGKVMLNTNIKGYERYTLHINGRINEILRAHPNVLDFRDHLHNKGEFEYRTITLVNNSEEVLKVVGLESDVSGITVDYPKNSFSKNVDITFVLSNNDATFSNPDHITIMLQSVSTSEIFRLPIKIIK